MLSKSEEVPIAISDACIFFDLSTLEITLPFFQLDLEVHTSWDVMTDLPKNQRNSLHSFEQSGQLTVHRLSEKDRKHLREQSYPRVLCESDQTVIFLALRLQAAIVASDKVVRDFALTRGLEAHSMLWIVEQLVQASLIGKKDAASKLEALVKSNLHYQNNLAIRREMADHLKRWITANS